MSELTKFIEKGAAIAKGKREILRGIHDGEIAFVSVAKDADYSFRSEILLVCSMKKIPTESAMTMAELSAICSISVPCGAVGIKKVKEEKPSQTQKNDKAKETSKDDGKTKR